MRFVVPVLAVMVFLAALIIDTGALLQLAASEAVQHPVYAAAIALVLLLPFARHAWRRRTPPPLPPKPARAPAARRNGTPKANRGDSTPKAKRAASTGGKKRAPRKPAGSR
jgi:hypothetical protein